MSVPHSQPRPPPCTAWPGRIYLGSGGEAAVLQLKKNKTKIQRNRRKQCKEANCLPRLPRPPPPPFLLLSVCLSARLAKPQPKLNFNFAVTAYFPSLWADAGIPCARLAACVGVVCFFNVCCGATSFLLLFRLYLLMSSFSAYSFVFAFPFFFFFWVNLHVLLLLLLGSLLLLQKVNLLNVELCKVT